MLKVLAVILDIVGGLFSLLAPVAVVHWMLGFFDIDAIAGVMGLLDGAFSPLNYAIEWIVPLELPEIDYGGKKTPITQGLLAFVFTLFFLILAGAAYLVRMLDKKIELETAIQRTKKRAKEREEVSTIKSQNTISASRLLIYLKFAMESERNVSSFLQTFKDYGGREERLSETDKLEADETLIVFDDALQGLSYAMQTGEKVMAYYTSLRPMDPQPPFYMTLHTVESTHEALIKGINKEKAMIRYAGDNQIVFSQQLLDLLTERSKVGNYHYQSLGYYNFEGESSQELFRLFYKEPSQNPFY